MHAAIETLRKFGLTSEPDLLDVEKFDKKKVIKAYEQLYSAVHEGQNALPEPKESSIDPFTFTASASMRAESTCWEWPCRLQKLDFLARYSALYANRVIVPMSLRHPDQVKDVSWARSLLTHSGLTLLQLRLLIVEGIVTPVVMVTNHCEHIQPWVDEMVRLVHAVSDGAAAEVAHRFRTVYQSAGKSPTGRSTIYVDGPEDFLEHGSLVQLFDEGAGWRPKSWRFNRLGRREVTGPRKVAVLRRIFGQIATDTTFYLAFGRGHTGRYLTDRRGEALLLELLTGDQEVAASSAVLSAHMSHAVPLLGDLRLSTLVDLRKQERDSFARYRAAVERMFGEVLQQKGHITARDAREIFKLNIEPQLLKMKSELRQEQQRQKRRIAGGLAALVASVGIGAFGAVVPLLAKAAAVGASAMVGGRLLSKAAEAKCEHGTTLRERNDFYFLLRLAQESEKS